MNPDPHPPARPTPLRSGLAAAAAAVALALATASRPAAQEPPPAAPPVPPAAAGNQTVITAARDASFDNAGRVAVFSGNVSVTDPRFTLSADKLTVYLKPEGSEPAAAAAAAPAPGPTAEPASGSLDRAVAEGNVLIIQIQQGDDGKPTRSAGRARKAVYDAKTGDITLSGWPAIQQGINSHIATEEGTVMVLTRGGRLKTDGASRTVIQEQPEETTRRTP